MLFEFIVAGRTFSVPYTTIITSSQLVRDYSDTSYPSTAINNNNSGKSSSTTTTTTTATATTNTTTTTATTNTTTTATTNTTTTVDRLQLPLPSEYSRAVVHYVNFLTVRKKRSLDKDLTTDLLLERFALANFLQADGYFNWNIKCLFRYWSRLSPTLYSTTTSQDVLERIVIRLPYNLLPQHYRNSMSFMTSWVETNMNKIVEFEDSYFYHMAEAAQRLTYFDGDVPLCCYRTHYDKQPLTALIRVSTMSVTSAMSTTSVVQQTPSDAGVATTLTLSMAKEKGLIDNLVTFIYNRQLTPAIRNLTVDKTRTGLWLEVPRDLLVRHTYVDDLEEGPAETYSIIKSTLNTADLSGVDLSINCFSDDESVTDELAAKNSLHYVIIKGGGRLRTRVSYIKGKRDGSYENYSETGVLLSRGSYQKGTQVGAWQKYYDNGQLHSKGCYSADGLKIGLWHEYYSSGKVVYIGNYHQGIRVK